MFTVAAGSLKTFRVTSTSESKALFSNYFVYIKLSSKHKGLDRHFIPFLFAHLFNIIVSNLCSVKSCKILVTKVFITKGNIV